LLLVKLLRRILQSIEKKQTNETGKVELGS
jgi:hypothetical protein